MFWNKKKDLDSKARKELEALFEKMLADLNKQAVRERKYVDVIMLFVTQMNRIKDYYPHVFHECITHEDAEQVINKMEEIGRDY